MASVGPGSPFPGPFAKADVANSILESADEYRLRRRLGKSEPAFQFSAIQTDVIKIQNDAAADLAIGSVVQVDIKVLTTLDAAHLWFSGIEPDDEICGNAVAILREPIPDGKIGPAQVSGVCLARVNVTDTSHRYAYPVSGNTVLQSGHGGPFQLLEPATGVTEDEFPVLFPVAPPHRHGINEAVLSQGGTATVNVVERIGGVWQYVGLDVTGVDFYLNTGESVEAGHLMRLDFDCGDWVVENWYCLANDTLGDVAEAESGGAYITMEDGSLLEFE